MIKTAVILAGGFGKRLQQVVSDVPKPMAPVNGEPFLNYLLSYLAHFGVKHVIISTGYLAEKITSFYGNEFHGMKIGYSHEEQPLGTGGGIRLALEKCNDPLSVVINGDSFFDVDLDAFYNLHSEQKAQVSLALREVEDASRYGTIGLGEASRIISFKEKSDDPTPGLINGGVYILDKALYLEQTAGLVNFSIEKDFFEKQLGRLWVKGFEFKGYFIDIGIPADYNKAQDDFKGFKY